MKKKIPISGIVIGIVIGIIISIAVFSYFSHSNNSNNTTNEIMYHDNSTRVFYDLLTKVEEKNNTMYITAFTNEGREISHISILIDSLLFKHSFYLNNGLVNYSDITPNPVNNDIYQKIGLFNTPKKMVYVYPIFTQAAYEKNGFYDYYNNLCDSKCLTVYIPDEIHGKYTSSIRAASILSILNYTRITDIDIDKNPDIIKNYDRVIVLHSEYVTKKEFDAITNHPDVVYLYPNSLYAEVNVDYKNNTITLVRGHGYPDKNVTNGFGWKFDNSQYEYDTQCDNWAFYKVDNGKMLNCYPAFRMYFDKDLLAAIKIK